MTGLLFVIPLLAQTNEDDENDGKDYGRRSSSYWNRTKIGGAGGVTPVAGIFDNKEIDKYLTAAGLPALGTDPHYLIGGEGYGYIMFLKNVRMGGFGVTGNRSVSALQPITGGGNLRKEVDYEISYGGFLIDYVQPIAYRLDIAVGASIGGGQVRLKLQRDNGGFKDWNTLWNDYGNPNSQSVNYTRRIDGAFVVFNPHINVEYTILPWLQLRMGAGYPIFISSEWQLDETFQVNSVPSDMKAKGYTVNAGLMFGYFGW